MYKIVYVITVDVVDEQQTLEDGGFVYKEPTTNIE